MDLLPLRDMPLVELDFYNAAGVKNLAPLKGMPLKYLNLGHTAVSDLSPISDSTTLQDLIVSQTPVTDLSVLKGLPLKSLRMQDTTISDLTPLKNMPLRSLWVNVHPGQNDEFLRSLTGLEQINGVPAAEFWKAQGK